MSRSIVLLVVLLIGVALAAWLLGGGLSPDGGDALSRDGEDGAGGPELVADGEGVSGAADEDAGPVLFGRPPRERAGRGSVNGRVLTAATSEPVAGVKVLLAGEGFGGEAVAWRGQTSEDGKFRIPDVAAGDDYELVLEARPHPGRTLPGVSVRAGIETALGTLWVGAKVPFVGRVVDESGRGIPGAVVGVHAGHFSMFDLIGSMTEMFAHLDREPEGLASTSTDGNGGFTFDALDPGPLTLTVRAAGYEPTHRDVVAADRVADTPLTIRLLAGQVVSGRVVDARGAGVPGARVAAVSSEKPQGFLFGRTFSRTDDDGAFRLDASASTDEVLLLASAPGYAIVLHKTPPGSTDVLITLDRSASLVVRVLQEPSDEPVEGASVLLTISATGTLQGEEPQTAVSGTTDAAGRIVADTSPGKIQMVMVSGRDGRFGMWMGESAAVASPMMMKGPPDSTVKAGRQEIVFRLSDSVVMTGVIRDDAGAPVVGARVIGGGGLQLAKPAFTDEEGRYRVYQNRGGFALVVVRADGFVPLQEMIHELPATGDLERDFTLMRAAIVTGRVLDAAGRPLPGARVRAKGANPGGGMAMMGFLGESEALTDGRGRYVLDGVLEGESVRVMARHTATADGVSEPFAVGKGGAVRAPDVVLHAGLSVDVLVRDPDGRPVAEARVELSFDRGTLPAWDELDMWTNDADLVTNAEGHVAQEMVPPCELTVTATHADFAQGKAVREIAPAATSPVRIEVSLRVPARIAGFVLGETGQPIEGVWVSVQPDGETIGTERVTTDADGYFLFASLPEGPFTLRARASGRRSYEEHFPAAREDLVVRLPPFDQATAELRAQLTAKIAEVYERLQSATNDKERKAISAELQALGAELQALGSPSSEGDR